MRDNENACYMPHPQQKELERHTKLSQSKIDFIARKFSQRNKESKDQINGSYNCNLVLLIL
jgi:hypothetical protein